MLRQSEGYGFAYLRRMLESKVINPVDAISGL